MEQTTEHAGQQRPLVKMSVEHVRLPAASDVPGQPEQQDVEVQLVQ